MEAKTKPNQIDEFIISNNLVSINHNVTDKINIKIFNKSNFKNPQYADFGSAGCDLQANISSDPKSDINEFIVINPGEVQLIPTGLFISLPTNYEAQIRPRSGLAAKNKITVLNSPGTIDSSYRGEIKVILYNGGSTPFTVEHGDRIAQMVIAYAPQASWVSVSDIKYLGETERGDGGFGHTGVK